MTKPIRDTAEELYGALDKFPDHYTFDIGDDMFRVRDLRALALFVKEGAEAK